MQQKIMHHKNTKAQRDKFFIAISHLIQLSPLFKASLLEFFNFNPIRFFQADKADLIAFSEQFPDIKIPRNFLELKSKINPDAVYDEIIEAGVKFITIDEPDFPHLLKQICDFPPILYYKGEFNPEIFENTLAIVGSRRASEGAKAALGKIIKDMANSNATIVSGLAYGIDATAHKSAIEAGLKTIGVIASGLEHTYPSSNRGLYHQIENGNGLIVTEFPPKVPPMVHHFPLRNRIVTGLSYGTLVAEAALKSGALISGNLTLEQNRELMCMPGLISNPNTEGIYKLLKNGAALITSAEDIFENLNWNFENFKEEIKLNDVEKIVFDIISLEEVSVEKIQQQCGFDVSKLMITLTGLELRGLIKQTNGRYFITGL